MYVYVWHVPLAFKRPESIMLRTLDIFSMMIISLWHSFKPQKKKERVENWSEKKSRSVESLRELPYKLDAEARYRNSKWFTLSLVTPYLYIQKHCLTRSRGFHTIHLVIYFSILHIIIGTWNICRRNIFFLLFLKTFFSFYTNIDSNTK